MPSELSIRSLLRELLGPRVEPPSLGGRGEDEALAAWEARYGAAAPAAERGRGGGLGPVGLLAPRRLVFGLGGLALAVVGACVLPTSYEVPIGLSVEIHASEGERLPTLEIARYVRERSDAAEVEVMMREEIDDDDPAAGADTTMTIRLWDQNLALGEIEPELRELFPGLASAEIVETALEGEFETTWGRRLAHRTFALSLRDAEIEEIRAQVLIDLQAHGAGEGTVVVVIHEDGEHRDVDVQQRHVITLDGDGRPQDGGQGLEWVADPELFRELELPPGQGPDGGGEREVRIEIERIHE